MEREAARPRAPEPAHSTLSIDLPVKTIRKLACDAIFQSALEGNYPDALDEVKSLANSMGAAPVWSDA
jgi:hypothetical protein